MPEWPNIWPACYLKVFTIMGNAAKIRKKDIVENIYGKMRGFSKAQIKIIVDFVFSEIKEALLVGPEVKIELRGFGTFENKFRQSRVARNPRTGEKVLVEAHYAPYFRAGKELKEKLQGNRKKNIVDNVQ